MSKKKKKKAKAQITINKKHFMPMSKKIGVIIFFLASLVVAYAMYEMHITQDISSLEHLIIGVFAMLASYIGFYINMAKAEHLEDKKNQIKRELELLRRDGISEDEVERERELQQELDGMNTTTQELYSKEEFKHQ